MGYFFLFSTFTFLIFLWDLEFRIRRIFRSPRFEERITRRVVAIPRRILSLTRNFLDFDVDFEIQRGLEIPQQCLIISNHQSIIDIPFMVYCLPNNKVRFVAKGSLFTHVPLISQILRIQKHARIDRTGKFSKTMKELERLANNTAVYGLTPIIFPEGTRSRSGLVQTFHSGAVRKIESIANLSILTVAINGGYKISRLREMFRTLKGHRYKIKALSLYPAPQRKQDVESILEKAREEIQHQVQTWQAEEKKAGLQEK